MEDFERSSPTMSGKPDILASGASSISYTLPIPTLYPLRTSASAQSLTTSTSSLVSPSSTSSSTVVPSAGLSTGLKAAAIAIPVVFVALLIPLVYLIIRSHQIRKAAEQGAGQRSSQQAMIPPPMSGPQTIASPTIGFRPRGPTPSRPRSPKAPRRSVNSLGLFDFELATPKSPFTTTPKTPRLSRPFSLVRPKSKIERSADKSKDLPAPTPTLSRSSTVVEPSGAGADSRSPLNPHFAPLNQIGLAHTRDGRVKAHANETRRNHDQDSPVVQDPQKPALQRGSQESHWSQGESSSPVGHTAGEPFDRARDRAGVERQLSAVSRGGDSAALSMTNRFSDVSALTFDEGDHRRSSNIFPGAGDFGGAQPHRIL